MTDEITTDSILDDRLRLRQPRRGHRAGSDAILLAAAAPVRAGDNVLDIGAGVGAVGLALALRCPRAMVDLVEIDPALATRARENSDLNDLAQSVGVLVIDFMSAPQRKQAGLHAGAADVVVSNPPYFEAGAVRISPDADRARAHVLAPSADIHPLQRWIAEALSLLRPGGCFVMIHLPEALNIILGAFAGQLGSQAILPIYPKAAAPAHRLLIGGVKGARGPTRLLPGLILHDASGGFTPQAEALHRGQSLLDLGLPRARARKPPR